MMMKASPRTSLYVALCAALVLPACGDSAPEDSTGTGSNTASNDTASASTKTGEQTTGTGDGSSAETSSGSAATDGSSSSDNGSASSTDTTTAGTTTGETSSTGDTNTTGTSTDTTTTEEVKVTFKKDVLPIFAAECGCHRGNQPADNLDLGDANAYGSLVGTGKNGPGGVPYVKANDSAGSYLYQSVNYTATPEVNRMPKAGKMTDAKVKVIKDWIDGGAVQE